MVEVIAIIPLGMWKKDTGSSNIVNTMVADNVASGSMTLIFRVQRQMGLRFNESKRINNTYTAQLISIIK